MYKKKADFKSACPTKPEALILFILLPSGIFDPSNEPVYRRTDQESDQNEYEKYFFPTDYKHWLTGK